MLKAGEKAQPTRRRLDNGRLLTRRWMPHEDLVSCSWSGGRLCEQRYRRLREMGGRRIIDFRRLSQARIFALIADRWSIAFSFGFLARNVSPVLRADFEVGKVR
jgi:hypothetical protein